MQDFLIGTVVRYQGNLASVGNVSMHVHYLYGDVLRIYLIRRTWYQSYHDNHYLRKGASPHEALANKIGLKNQGSIASQLRIEGDL